MNKEQEKLLLAPFKTQYIQWRICSTNKEKTKGCAVGYIDSRAIQNRLDDVLGKENWQNSFSAVSTGNVKDQLANICTISIYYPDRKEWISKSDGAGCTDIEPIKGGISDAFKRAASMWGIGRYMYELSEIWVELKDQKYIQNTEYSKLRTEYENAVVKIFKTKSVQQSGNLQPSPSTKAAPAKQNNTPTTPASPLPPASTPANFYTVKSTSLSKGASGENTTVELIKPDKSVVTAYIKGNPGLKQGQKLSKVKATEKNHVAMGKYFVIDEYQVAA